MKSPLEAIVESLGSVINQHGSENRGSLLPSNISNEFQLLWNGPNEFDSATDSITDEAVKQYFKKNAMGVRFYVSTALKITSSTVWASMSKPSCITGL